MLGYRVEIYANGVWQYTYTFPEAKHAIAFASVFNAEWRDWPTRAILAY